MKPAPFEYCRPGSLREVLEHLSDSPADTKIIAGGQSLVPMMNFRMAQPARLIDINHVPGLDRIHVENNVLKIGAMARHVRVKESNVVAETCPVITMAYEHIAHTTVRNRGTIGGNMCHADPASEMPAVLLMLNGVLKLEKLTGTRLVSAKDFFIGALNPAIENDEILTEIQIPLLTAPQYCGFEEFASRRGDLALSGIVVGLSFNAGAVSEARVALFGTSDIPLRIHQVESRLLGKKLNKEVISSASAELANAVPFESGLNVSSEYRRDVSVTLLERALHTAWEKSRSVGNE
jgi:carbon-monoxide dehydrogenase medium subunit